MIIIQKVCHLPIKDSLHIPLNMYNVSMVQLQDTHCSKLSSRSSSVFSFVRTLTPFCNLPPDGSPPENSRFLNKV